MSLPTHAPSRTGRPTTPEERKVLAGTLAGTTIEWYDFFIYAQAASLVLAPLFLSPVSEDSPGLATVLSLATIGISFLFRPLGAIVAGRFGDRLGRKRMLVFTLLLMGSATALIGLLPTYEQIGLAAPAALIVLRVLQGFSAGGEWGGAALMSVEHAPVERRGLFGAYPQIGVPIGMILATGVLWLLSTTTTPEQFQSWGWRIPFLLSVVLILIGYLIRRAVEESPVFKEMRLRKKESSAPLRDLFRRNTKQVVLSALIFIANNAAGYLLIAFFIAYASTTLGLPRPSVLLATTLASFGWLVFTMYGGALSDRIGRVRTFQIGYALVFVWMIPMFLLIDTRNIWLYGIALFLLTVGLGLSYGPMSAMYAEMFPVAVRYSGVSIGYALGAILGGAFAPMIAELLLQSTGWSGSVGVYIMVLCVISFAAVTAAGETRGRNLRVAEAHEEYLREHPDEAGALDARRP
ncbi:MFS transporter [Geodermatophilus poikilotrophus]|uniref:Predicted arabinose efflux permease, MFS family n=1 Tax=Geodermatophilus poikilotrophus TaxID=1333667 RepID=A0A1I0D4T7_9ACTN|nr:MFS transporter [Geodermatophilus poikilotrophus]SET27168.1 Predicted arabinose efflux permease, MFS family [Geodermatophilus poikilotrophus]